jgi:nucleoside-diphosphate-sugar epimerase
MKTLITGASGFIGRHVLQHTLLGETHVLSRRPAKFQSPEIIQHQGDLCDLPRLKEVATLRFDRLVHLAWSGLPSLSRDNNQLNASVSKDLINVFSDAGVGEINMVGSCLEYGSLASLVSEEEIGTNVSEFGETKLEILDYLASNHPRYRWMRIFYAYGPYQHPNSLLRQGYLQAKKGEGLRLVDPTLSKDFIYVGDVASGISTLINKKSEFGIYNVGSGSSTSVGQMVNLVNERMGLPSNGYGDNPISLRADTRKIHNACGWTPTTNISAGVNKSVQWMIENNV